MLELARSLGLLTKEGHRPKRTIVFCSWDAEEYTLTGSTEWAEQWQGKLRKDGVTYINVDSACRGPRFSATAMPFLRDFMNSITKEVIDPNTGMSIYDARMREAEDRQRTTPAWAEALEEERPEAIISTRVGSGSDHTAFINFICMPVIGLGFGGPYGVYHSQYDNFYWMSHFGDPQFRYHSTMSVIWGMTALRLANADLLPFDYSAYGQAILSYLEEKEKGVSDTLLSDLKSLRENIDNFKINAQRLNQRINQLLSSGEQISPQTADLINTSLMKLERCFGHDGGIPNRSWFKHLVYAPKFTYASEVIPGITEAVEDEDWERAKEQIRLMGNALNKANETLLVPLEQIKSSNPRSK
jgi:N-acetylated-alpha-linked acidic dipeptidase